MSDATKLDDILRAWDHLDPEDQVAVSLHAPDLRRALVEAQNAARPRMWAIHEERVGAIARGRT